MAAKCSVLNADKDKILVVFYCNSQYREILITENLFYGPYLTNPLISALKKISLGLVASMVNIQTLFHLVRIQSNCRLFLRFWCWNVSILDLETVDHEMCINLFVAVSSHGSRNYELSKNSYWQQQLLQEWCCWSNNEEPLRGGFSPISWRSSMRHRCNKKPEKMYNAGAFNLMNFISCNKSTRMSIPVNHRRNIVKVLG